MAGVTDKASGSTQWVPNKLNVWRAVLAFWLLTFAGVGALLLIDHEKGLRPSIARLLAVLMRLTFPAGKAGGSCRSVLEAAPAFDSARRTS